MRIPGLTTVLAAAVLAIALPAAAQKTTLLVYTALETDQLKAYQEGFNKVQPDIEIKWVRDSTGVITAKLLAEKGNPGAQHLLGDAHATGRGAATTTPSSPSARAPSSGLGHRPGSGEAAQPDAVGDDQVVERAEQRTEECGDNGNYC